jgi:hypothetical protein
MSELTEMGTTTGGVPEWWVVKEIKRCWRGCCPRFCCALRWQVRGGLQFLARLGENIRQAIIERVPTQNRGSEIPAEGLPISFFSRGRLAQIRQTKVRRCPVLPW